MENVRKIPATCWKIASYLARPGTSTALAAARGTATVIPMPSVPVISNVARTTVTGVMGTTAVRKKVKGGNRDVV